MSEDEQTRRWKLKLLLDESYEWPTEYLFKFIVPMDQLPRIIVILNGFNIEEKPSTGGKYISVSAKKVLNSSEEVLKIYESVKVIKGIISL